MNKNLIYAALCGLTLASPTWAQTSAYTIYPIPQQVVMGTGKASLTQKVCIVCEKGIDEYTRQRASQVLTEHGLEVEFADAPSATQSNLYLGINGSGLTADAYATTLQLNRDVFGKAEKYDRHALAIKANGSHADVLALGENTDATFYALASLEQILDNGTDQLTPATIYDFADQKSRGLVEGYYGYPYSIDVKKDLMRFMMRYKMNTYLYGAKSDPYHSDYWQNPYPTSVTDDQKKKGWLSQDMVKEIAETSHQTKVNFIWAIHPGNNFIYSSTVVNDIMSKYSSMYNLGVRQFAVFVDDVGVPEKEDDLQANADHLTQLQKALEKKYNTPTAAPNDTVRPLHFVPQVYCTAFASDEVRKKFFAALSTTPSYVTVYTTGYGVWSVPNSSDLNTIKNDLGRNAQWWWNYPCNDNADGQIYPMDMYSNFYDLPAVNSNATLPAKLNNGLGIVSNPMQEGEVSKTALFSVADYAWNNAQFSNQSSWEASFKAVLPGNEKAQKAYRYLAPYLRYNDPESLNQLISSYKSQGDATALCELMTEIKENCDVLVGLKDSQVDGERLLYTDLSPWLLKLRTMADVTDGLLRTAQSSGQLDETLWNKYMAEVKQVASLSTAEEFKAYALEGMGSNISVSVRPSQPSQLHLLGFIDYLQKKAMSGAFQSQPVQKSIESFSNVEGLKGKIQGASKVSIIQPTPFTLHKGEYIGTKLKEPTLVSNISVSDTLLANHTIVMSENGKEWTRITSTETTPESYVRYVAVVNDNEEPTTLKLVVKSIVITLPEATKVKETTIPDGAIWSGMTKDKMTDKNYTTFVCLNRNQKNGDAYTLQLTKKQPVRLVRIGMGLTNQDYMTTGKVQISTDGKNWTNLKVKGSSTTDFKMSLPQVTQISDEVAICDFDGEGKEALYVRLYLSQANTSKWLRLYEIEVNGEGAFTQARCSDAAGGLLPQACDADASTSTANAQKNALTYHFQELKSLRSVTLYNDPSTTANATIELSENGSDWSEAKSFTSSIEVVDMTEWPNATQMRIKWKGNAAPAIYEIVENESETQHPVVNRIEEATTGQTGNSPVRAFLNGHSLQVEAACGLSLVEIFTTDGRLLLHAKLNGQATAQLPILGGKSACIVRVTSANGSTSSFKLM